jgi:hypothetical protein
MNRLDQEVARLVTATTRWRPSWTWRTIRFAEAADVRPTGHAIEVPQRALCPAEGYADRFEAHLRAGYAWVNLHAAGVVDGVLVVIVEVPNHPSGVPYDRVAVNLSGPSAALGVAITHGRGA